MNARPPDVLPNILLIVCDQQRYDCLGRSRQYPVRTPCLDRLAEQGAWFSNAYTPIPLCTPARQALLNGRRPEAFGGLWNYGTGMPVGALEPEEYAWPRDLADCGYQSAYIGKWHVHPVHDPTRYGYGRYIPEEDYHRYRAEKYPDVWFGKPDWLKNGWFGEIDPVRTEDSLTHWMAKQATDILDEFARGTQPWHLRIDFTAPHLPCTPVEEFAGLYSADSIPAWRSFGEDFINKPYIQKQQLYTWGVQNYTWADWSKTAAFYYGLISQTDDAIGRILDRLDQLGQTRGTLVIYTADHGDMCGGHRMMDKHYVLYDDVVHVPLILRWPGVIAPQTAIDDFVSNILDLPPTILEAIGRQPREFFHGRSLMPLLQGERPDDWRQEIVSTYNGQQLGLYTQRMIRTRRWKYIWNATDIDELYDLAADPDELRNLIGDGEQEAILAELRRRLYEILIREGNEFVRNSWLGEQFLHNQKI
ncbi:MAG TPA: sulfatase [Clostridiales bacterium]|nr:sulfatase [Clostridiales bacterium]